MTEEHVPNKQHTPITEITLSGGRGIFLTSKKEGLQHLLIPGMEYICIISQAGISNLFTLMIQLFRPFRVISGGIVVWEGRLESPHGKYDRNCAPGNSGNSDIYIYDIIKGAERQVCTDEGDQEKPCLMNDKIVWQDSRNGKWNIHLFYP